MCLGRVSVCVCLGWVSVCVHVCVFTSQGSGGLPAVVLGWSHIDAGVPKKM